MLERADDQRRFKLYDTQGHDRGHGAMLVASSSSVSADRIGTTARDDGMRMASKKSNRFFLHGAGVGNGLKLDRGTEVLPDQ